MKKNAFLTFIFACIPGAGQMYYGYMKRGLSMITFFCLFIMAGTLVDVLVVGSVIVWMYSFFDTYDLIRHMAAGEPKEDSLLVLGNYEEIKKLLPQHNRLIGWGPGRLRRTGHCMTHSSQPGSIRCCVVLWATATPTTSSPAYRMLSLRHC